MRLIFVFTSFFHFLAYGNDFRTELAIPTEDEGVPLPRVGDLVCP